MSAFNKERFLNFAKLDLTINRTFYRNLSLVTLVGVLGIVAMFFSIRYSIWKMASGHDVTYTPFVGSYEHYNTLVGTSAFVTEFLMIMAVIFAGCWAHNLRNKQGRITELTLPATNAEKFVWHTSLMIGGGLLLCLASLLLADGFNALLTLCFCPLEDGVSSISACVFNILTLDLSSLTYLARADNVSYIPDLGSVAVLLSFFMFSLMLCNLMIYLFGNAVKYKYNIILTYIVLYAFEIILTIIVLIFVVACASMDVNHVRSLSGESVFMGSQLILFLISCVILAVAFILPIWSYHLYTKAQITSKMNK